MMLQPLERIGQTPAVWCGRSWEGLAARRHAAFKHAVSLRDATVAHSSQAVSEFLAFFDESGISLFRDEEEWIFRALRPTPRAVLRALEDHIEISELIGAMLREARTGRVALGMVQHLGESLKTHLLLEEEEIRPLFEGSHTALRPVI